MKFFVYILQCKDEYIYTGISWNLNRRLTEHNLGKAPNTKNRLPLKLVYKEEFKNRSGAAKREKEIKGWSREKKTRLIRRSVCASYQN